MESVGAMTPHVLLIDIDGTLLRVERSATRALWTHAWREVIGGQPDWQRIDTAAGKTDLQLLAQLLGDDHAAQRYAPRFFDALASYAPRFITRDTLRVLPAVVDFLQAAQAMGAILAVLTGNERRCG